MESRRLCVLFVLLLLSHGQSSGTTPIKKVIFLMMENRSFDNMLGWLRELNPDIDGLTGQECNLYNSSDPDSQSVCVTKTGYDTGPDDPDHSFEGTAEEIFGFSKPVGEKAVPKMNGFVQNAYEQKHDPTNPMRMFSIDNSSAPVLNTLAMEFGVIDKYFCSIPGPTDPNRAFAMSGTSNGMVTNFNQTLWNQQSFFDFLRRRNHSFHAYYQDDPWAIMYFQDTHTHPNVEYVFELDDFYKHLQNGSVAEFTWLQPRMTTHADGGPTWQHPDASVKEGEKLIKSVYEAIRASSIWEEVLFVISYDEHGGFFDHCEVPQTNIPSPDGVRAPNGFTFDRLGVRIPTVVISPFINSGTVMHEPSGPYPSSQFDGTSIIATTRKLFGINESMTKRDDWAGTFEGVINLKEPRKDCIEKLPTVAEWTMTDFQRQSQLPLNDHMQIQVEFYCKFNNRGDDCEGRQLTNQLDASNWLIREAKEFMTRKKKL